MQIFKFSIDKDNSGLLGHSVLLVSNFTSFHINPSTLLTPSGDLWFNKDHRDSNATGFSSVLLPVSRVL